MSRKLSWGVDGHGNRHMICDLLDPRKSLGIMSNSEQFDFEDKFCSKCESKPYPCQQKRQP